MTISTDQPTDFQPTMDDIADALGRLDDPEESGDGDFDDDDVDGSTAPDAETQADEEDENPDESEDEEDQEDNDDEEDQEDADVAGDEAQEESNEEATLKPLSDEDMAREITFRSNGRDVTLPLEKVISMAQMGDNYSENQRALKEQRQKFQQEAKRKQDQLEADTAGLLQVLNGMKTPHAQAYQQLIANPPGEYGDQGAWAAQVQQAQAAINYYDHTHRAVADQYHRNMQQYAAEYVTAQTEAIREAVPDWGHEHSDLVRGVLGEFGVQEDTGLSAGVILGAYALAKARKQIAEMEKAKAAAEETRKKTRARKSKPIPSQVPRKRSTNPKRTRNQKAREALRSQGSIDQAADFFGGAWED